MKRNRTSLRALPVALLAAFVLHAPLTAAALRILTGQKAGNYFQAARDLQALFRTHGLKLQPLETPGSFANIARLGRGEAELAIAQYDVIFLYSAYLRRSQKKLVNNCLVVAPLGYEAVHIVVAKSARLKSFSDLKHKRLAVGPENSGTWISASIMMRVLNGVDLDRAAGVAKIPYLRAMREVAAGKIDAAFITSMSGVPLLKDLPPEVRSKIRLLSFGSDYRLPARLKGFYSLRRLPAGTYPWQRADVYTLATPSYLLAYRKLPERRVERITRLIYGNLKTLRAKNELWKELTLATAREDIANAIPYHPGARKVIAP